MDIQKVSAEVDATMALTELRHADIDARVEELSSGIGQSRSYLQNTQLELVFGMAPLFQTTCHLPFMN